MELCRECKYFIPKVEFWGNCTKHDEETGVCEYCDDWEEKE
ncbi:hypothetical protein [Sedimentibacter hydroxybenzoicus]|nr:hypothetical protein [Sedimentibacter hydroxybenzoicus]